MVTVSSWLEWIVCLLTAVSAVMAFRKGRIWLLIALLALIAGWFLGTAKGLLIPAAIGSLALWATVRAGALLKASGLTLALGGALASALLCWVFPLPEIPALSGPSPVGTMTFTLPAGGGSPPLLTQVWYPSRVSKSAPRAPWLSDPALTPRFPFHRQGNALANARNGLELSDASAKFPVIFYEHAWNGHRQENVAQVEDLASHGFIVIAVDHPGQAGRVLYPDGKVIVTRLPASFELASEGEVADFEKLAEQCLVERIQQLTRVKQALADRVPAMFAGRLALEHSGVFGFSFGGTTALRCCAQDPSFYAGANEDGMFLGDENPRGPFLFFDEQQPGWLLKPAGPAEGAEDSQTRRSETRIRNAMKKPDRYRMVLDGTLHPAFMDRIFTCRIPWLARVGTRSSAEIHQLITSRLTIFFKETLLQPTEPPPEPNKTGR